MLSGDGCLHSKGCAFCLALAPEQLQPLCSSLSHPYCPGGQVQPVPPIPNPLLLLLLTPIPTHPRHRSHTQKAPMQKKKKKKCNGMYLSANNSVSGWKISVLHQSCGCYYCFPKHPEVLGVLSTSGPVLFCLKSEMCVSAPKRAFALMPKWLPEELPIYLQAWGSFWEQDATEGISMAL